MAKEQLINVKTGEFRIGNEFTVSAKTKKEALLSYFGEQELGVRDFKNGHSNYSIRNLKIAEWYFIITFYYLQESLTKIDFVLQAEPYSDTGGWANFNEQKEIEKGKYMDQWMARQMGGDYKKYDWGKAGVSYDFHNRSSCCFVTYNSETNSSL